MPVENSMRNPQKLIGKPFILLLASGSLAVLYFFSGFFGYLRFGDAIQGTITLNLPTDDWSAIAGQALIGIALFSNFGLMFFIPMEILFKLIHKKIAKSRNISEIAIRTIIIILMVVIGIIIPDIGIFISLVGGFTSTCTSFITPVTIETVFLQANGGFGRYHWKLCKNILLLMFAFTSMVTATFLSIKNVVEIYTK